MTPRFRRATGILLAACIGHVAVANAQQTTRVSVDSSGNQAMVIGGVGGVQGAISTNGRFVAFSSDAVLASGDTTPPPPTPNPDSDVYIHDLLTGETRLVSRNSAGVEGNDASHRPSLTADGRFVAFWSDADNLVAGDTNDTADVFIRDLTIDVTLDIKPGIVPNEVNLRSRGSIPVAILTTAEFDATRVDVATVRFGPAGATEIHGIGHRADIDADGDLDLVFHFSIEQSGIACGATTATLTGQTVDGLPFVGSDSIVTVRCP